MAYVRKIIAQDEQLHGIARLHWIYVLRGLMWFLMLAFAGWAGSWVIRQGAFLLADASSANLVPLSLLNMADIVFFFLAGGGLFVFLLMVIKVLVTEVALTSRRVVLKEGLLFVKVLQVDLEEIRGEHMDLGTFGRILGYGYLNLDCRFIGDVKLPAIENPERFLNALHSARSKTQDALALVVGKGEKVPVVEARPGGGPDSLSVKPPEPTPEIQPGQQPDQPEITPPPTTPSVPRQPEIPTMPTPHNPPPDGQPMPQPESPPAQPTQPTPGPINPEPPLQPPEGVQQQPAQTVVAHNVALDANAMAQVMEQAMPQVVQQVVKQMAEQGLIPSANPENPDDQIDKDLMASFDDARLETDGLSDDLRHKVEHAIH